MGGALVKDMPSNEPLLRVMALHALTYCERLFYLEEVEEIRIADERVYEGRILHESIPDYSGTEQLILKSERLGIYGKVDVIRTIDGRRIPYEYKKGRSRSEHGTAEAWPSDELQLAAYIMLVEEAINEPVNEGRIYYAADRRFREPMNCACLHIVRRLQPMIDCAPDVHLRQYVCRKKNA